MTHNRDIYLKLYVIHNLARFWATDLLTLHCQELDIDVNEPMACSVMLDVYSCMHMHMQALLGHVMQATKS